MRNRIGLILLALACLGTSLSTALTASAPAATTTTTTATVTSNPFGVAGGRVDKYGAAAHARMGAAHGNIKVNWPEVEPSRGVFDWTDIDQQMNAFAAAGLVPLVRIYLSSTNDDMSQFWATYPAEYGQRTGAKHVYTEEPPLDQAYLAELVTALAQRYPQVTTFSLGNEINDYTQWPGEPGRTACTVTACPMFDDYMTALQTARTALHAAHPGALMLDNGLGDRAFGYGHARAIYEASKSSASLVASVSWFNSYISMRYPANACPATICLNPKESPSTLLPKWKAIFDAPFDPAANQLATTGDRSWYLYNHEYANVANLDGVQIHSYDSVATIPAQVAYLQSYLHGAVPIVCSECGTFWTMQRMGKNQSQTLNYGDGAVIAGMAVKRAVSWLAAGAIEIDYLPLVWDATPTARSSATLPLMCSTGTAHEPVMCPGGTTAAPTALGRAYGTAASQLAVTSAPAPIKSYGAGVTGYTFQTSSGRVAVMWTPSGAWTTIDATRLGHVTSITNEYGTRTTQPSTAYRFAGQPVYVRLAT